MKRFGIYLATIAFICFMVLSAQSQNIRPGHSPAPILFVGSTPCDPFIKSLLRIQDDAKCEFLKWELTLYKSQINSDSFKLSVVYGESQPNTNGFINGGKKVEITGKYTIGHGIYGNPHIKVYHLNGASFRSSVLLAEMDQNILHFMDNEKKFIVGNGGWGYVLNRIN